jgi:hypothetical protein
MESQKHMQSVNNERIAQLRALVLRIMGVDISKSITSGPFENTAENRSL